MVFGVVLLQGSLGGWVVGVVLLLGLLVVWVAVLWGGAWWLCGPGGFAFGGAWRFVGWLGFGGRLVGVGAFGGSGVAVLWRGVLGGWSVVGGFGWVERLKIKKQKQSLQGSEQKVNQAIRRISAAASATSTRPRKLMARFPLWGRSASHGCALSGGGKHKKSRRGFLGN